MDPTWLVTVGWLTLMRRAAAVKLPSIATARNARACAGVIDLVYITYCFFEFALYRNFWEPAGNYLPDGQFALEIAR
jgi:hypothetical protein